MGIQLSDYVENNVGKGKIAIKSCLLLMRLLSKGLTLSQTTDFRLFRTERFCRGQFQIR